MEGLRMSERVEANKEEKTKKFEYYLDLMMHDLLNLNQAVQGYLELVQSGEAQKEEAMHFVESAIDQVRSSTQLIEDVRKIVHLGLIGDELLENTVVADMVRDAIDELGYIFPGRQIEVAFEDEAKEAIVRGTNILKDIVLNLLNNSVKFDKADSVKIDITLKRSEKPDNMVDIVIEDRGPGLPDTLKTALSTDMNIDGKTRRGTGIGLLLVSAAANRFGGKLILEDRVSGDYTKGAKVTVRLPEVQRE